MQEEQNIDSLRNFLTEVVNEMRRNNAKLNAAIDRTNAAIDRTNAIIEKNNATVQNL